MGKRWIWLLVVLAILLCSFLFPRIMLRITEKDMESRVLTYGTGTLLNFDVLTLGEKQSLLSSSMTQTITDSDISDEEYALLQETLSVELKKLVEFEAISHSFSDYLLTELSGAKVMSFRIYDSNGKSSFLYYNLFTDYAHVLLDKETGKILSFGTYRDPKPEGYQWDHFLRSIAEYYGMSVNNLESVPEEGATAHPKLAGCLFSGDVNTSFGFHVHQKPDGYREACPCEE